MGRKRKVPPGLQLINWRDSFDEASSDDDPRILHCPQLRTVTQEALLRQDLSPTPSAPESSTESNVRSSVGPVEDPASEGEQSSIPESQNVGLDSDDTDTDVPNIQVAANAVQYSEGGLDTEDWPEWPDSDAAEEPDVHDTEDWPEWPDSDAAEEPERPDSDVPNIQVASNTEDDNESLDSWQDDDPDPEDPANEYYSMLQALSEKWLLVELEHTVSKAASNSFWGLATTILPSLFEAKNRLRITRKVPQFVHIRRKLHKQYVPAIHHKTAFQQEGSQDVIHVDVPGLDPRLNDSHKKIFETATVSVITLAFFYFRQKTSQSTCCCLLLRIKNSFKVLWLQSTASSK